MRRSPSLSHRRAHTVAVTALACAVLFATPITPCSSAPAAPFVASAEAAWVPRLVPMRLRHGAIFDPVRDRILVFGGETSSGLTNSVLAFGLFGWSPIAVTGSAPVARRSAGVTYDPVRDRLLVFGGSDGTSTYNDVWALSLAGTPHWTFLGSGGALVASREEHVSVYDAAHDRLVVFGGIDDAGHVRSDGWAFSLSGPGTWSPLGTGGARPLARQSACGVYDPVRDRLLLYGGADSSGTPLSDTWALPLGAGGTWALLPLSTSDPGARMRATAAYDASRDEMVVYGGRGTGGLFNNVLTLSLAGTAAWNVPFSSTAPPAAREWAPAVIDPVRDRLVVVGGGTPGLSSDVSTFALGGTHPWSILTPSTKPGSLRAAALVHDPARNRILLFGGLDGSTATNALWSLDLSGPSVWTRLTPAGTPPGPRGYTTAVYDAARDRVLVFGGVNFSIFTLYNDVWALQLAGTPTWQLLTTAGTQPAPVYLHTAILDPVRDRMVVFGGSDGSTFNNVVRTLSLGGTPTWTFQPTADPKPAPRGSHGAIYDAVHDRMIVCGGTDFAANTFADTWSLPLAGTLQWQLLAPNGPAPAPRYLAAWAYDPGRNRMLVYGGRDLGSNRFSDVWALQFGASDQWVHVLPAGITPPDRRDHSAAFDPANDRLVSYGGTVTGPGGVVVQADDVLSIDWNPDMTSAPPVSPLDIALSPPFPNPMRDAVTIRFVTTDPWPVRIAIHDVAGRHVRTLEDEPRDAGVGLLRWDGRDERGARVAPGVYLVQMRSRGHVLSRRIVLTE